MCGIAGFVSPKITSEAHKVLSKMLVSINYRGPDESGTYFGKNVAMGIRRLSIIDVKGGRQPMKGENGKVIVVFNGEIYNFQELKDVLLKKGHVFKTDSDTEVIVHLYEDLGEGFLKQIDGMFAIALWDEEKERLFLARDRFGQKPLYYGKFRDSFIFGSEMKVILTHPSVKKELDINSVGRYLAFEYVPSPFSIFKGIFKLEPGSYLLFTKGKIEIKKYWGLSFKETKMSKSEILARLDSLLAKTIESHLVSDVPIGILLSGGLDSSTVAYYVSRYTPKAIDAFSIGFKDKTFDESSYAKKVAKHLKVRHHLKIFNSSDLLGTISGVSRLLDEPFADASLFPTFLLSKFARQYVTVALGGDGGDEIFMGYPTYQANKIADYYKLFPQFVDFFLAKIIRSLPTSYSNLSLDFRLKKGFEAIRRDIRVRNQIWLSPFGNSSDSVLSVSSKKQLGSHDPFEEIIKIKNLQTLKSWEALMGLYLKTYLAEDILVKTDRASMYNSLELRSPFLDHRLVKFVNSIPVDLKLNKFTGKYILKQLMKRRLPKDIVHRSKHGFGIPVGKWLKTDLKPLLLEKLSTPKIKRGGIFNSEVIQNLISEHLEGKKDNRKQLWTLLMFEIWKENWISS